MFEDERVIEKVCNTAIEQLHHIRASRGGKYPFESDEEIRKAIRWALIEFAKSKGIYNPYARTELGIQIGGISPWDKNQIDKPTRITRLGMLSIHNGKGALDEGKHKWINKTSIIAEMSDGKYRVSKHVVKTDAAMLEPFPQEFCNFVNKLWPALKSIRLD